MARAPLTTEPSRVYVGMLIVTCLAMALGITVLALESSEYGWEQKPPSTPKVDLPKDLPVAAAPGGAAMEPAPIVVPKTDVATLPLPPVEQLPPTVTVPLTLPPILLPPVATAEAAKPKVPDAKPAESKPLTTPPTPTPSPLVIPGR